MSVKKRIIEFIEYKGISRRQFEIKCNLSNGYIKSMRKDFGREKLELVLREFPDLSRDWLINGIGEMIKIESISENKELRSEDFLKAITDISQAAKDNAEANKLNAIANERNSRNMEELIRMLKLERGEEHGIASKKETSIKNR